LFANLLYASGYVGAQNLVARLSKSADPNVHWPAGQPLPVRSIDGCRDNPDQDFVGRANRLRHLLKPYDIRRAILGTNDSFHGLTVMQLPPPNGLVFLLPGDQL
jgi:hypothetical protein